MDVHIWLKDCGEHHEYIPICVDDLLTSSKDPQGAVDTLMSKIDLSLR